METTSIVDFTRLDGTTNALADLMRTRAQQLIAKAVEAGLADYLAQFTDLRTEAGHAAVVPNGHHPARPFQTGISPVSVRIPKVRSKDGTPVIFRSARLPLQQTTRMVGSILQMAGLDWTVPDFSTLSRRQKTITVQMSNRRAPGPLNLLVDSTGIKFLGDGEWLTRKHGTHRRRQYRKVHLAMDSATGDIRAVEFTSSDHGDSPVLPHLLDQIPPDEQIGTVTGDGAFDTRLCHTAILDRGGTAVIPIRKNGRRWKEDCPSAQARNDILRANQRLGRAIWKRWSGYHVRSRIEARMRCLKAFGERIASRDPDRQAAEVHIRVALMNRFNALGTAKIERVA